MVRRIARLRCCRQANGMPNLRKVLINLNTMDLTCTFPHVSFRIVLHLQSNSGNDRSPQIIEVIESTCHSVSFGTIQFDNNTMEWDWRFACPVSLRFRVHLDIPALASIMNAGQIQTMRLKMLRSGNSALSDQCCSKRQTHEGTSQMQTV